MAFELTPAREKELEKIAKDLPDKSFKSLYGKDWKSVKMATAMNILKKKLGFKEEKTKMKFTELRDIVEKMSGSKLTGQEVSTWYRKNPDVKKAAQKDKKVKQAVEIALDHGGAMNFAIKKIEKMKRGLADHPAVAKALSFANFGEEKTLEDGAGENSAAAQYAKDTPGQTPIGEETLTEGYSRSINDKDVDKEFKSFGNEKSQKEFFGDLDKARAEMKKDYHPGNSARPKVWTALRYPVRDRDYYFAFIDKNERKNMKYNEKLNDALRKAKVGGDKKSVDDMWLIASREVRTYPKSLGWSDTMTREEIYGAIQHMLGKISESNIIEKSLKTKAGIMVGKRMKAPRYESVMAEGTIKKDPLDRAERILSYKLKELQYKSELRRFNEFEEGKVKQYRMEANNAPLAKRAEKRFKGVDKKLAQRIANAVKPGRVIQSKLYVELGDLWDKGDKQGFEKHLKKHEK